jgi:RHS repeat-associated protein
MKTNIKINTIILLLLLPMLKILAEGPQLVINGLIVKSVGVNEISISASFTYDGESIGLMRWRIDSGNNYYLNSSQINQLEIGSEISINVGIIEFGIHAFRLEGKVGEELTWGGSSENFQHLYGLAINSVESKTILYPASTDVEIDNLAAYKFQHSLSYSNNNGKQIQTISKGSSPLQKDVVQHIEYDDIGLSSKHYLPYVEFNTSADGSFRLTAKDTLLEFYDGGTPNIAIDLAPYSQQEYELSPLLPVKEQDAPGTVWKDHTTKTEFLVNDINEVINWEINGTSLVGTSKYPASSLYKTKITDENGDSSFIYKNKKEQEILKASMYNGSPVSTYYVYDKYGNLRFVIPPEAVEEINAAYPVTLSETNSTRTKWITEYKYDSYNRQIEKHMPEEGVVTTIYDPLGRVILRQDSLFRANNDWLFTKYDLKGRVILTGSAHAGSYMTRQEMQELITDGIEDGNYTYYEERSETGDYYYTNNANPNIDVCDVWTVNYYDDYDFDNDGTDDASFSNVAEFSNTDVDETIGGFGYKIMGHTPIDSKRVKGKSTKSKVKILGNINGVYYSGSYDYCPASPNEQYYKGIVILEPGFRTIVGQEIHIGPDITIPPSIESESWLETISFYDDMGRVIQTQSTNHIDNTAEDITSTQYDFSGKVMRVKAEHMKGSSEHALTTMDRFEYDHAGRVLRSFKKINSDSEKKIVENVYNELGQVITKKLHNTSGSDFAEEVDYEYNIRGWLKKVNNPFSLSGNYFGYELLYNDVKTGLNNTGLFNGNISGMIWNSGNQTEAYKYLYDDLGRLTNADYATYASSVWTTSNQYKVTIPTNGYDLHGNIKNLTRYSAAGQVMDNLTYTYNASTPNMLYTVEDSQPDAAEPEYMEFLEESENPTGFEYYYDGNGNMTKDKNKDIDTIIYNYLNLPEKIKWTDGRRIEWLYTASGAKLRNTVYDNTGLVEEQTDYIGGFVYEKNFGSLDTELKYFSFSEGRILNEFEWQYEYFMKDHLGNVRKTFRLIGGMPETWQEDFYYPFGLRERRSVNGDENKELYNGKELTDAHNLFWYHYGVRYYDPQLGRWHAMDPADEFNSPYVYVGNNPINLIDPDGAQIVHANNNSDMFKNNYSLTLDYLKNRGIIDAVNILDKLSIEMNQPITLKEGRWMFDTYYNHNTHTLIYNPNYGLQTSAGIQTPALGFYHEVGHAIEHLKNPTSFESNLSHSKRQLFYSNPEEFRNLFQFEIPAVIKAGEPLRSTYEGFPVYTGNPTSTNIIPDPDDLLFPPEMR